MSFDDDYLDPAFKSVQETQIRPKRREGTPLPSLTPKEKIFNMGMKLKRRNWKKDDLNEQNALGYDNNENYGELMPLYVGVNGIKNAKSRVETSGGRRRRSTKRRISGRSRRSGRSGRSRRSGRRRTQNRRRRH